MADTQADVLRPVALDAALDTTIREKQLGAASDNFDLAFKFPGGTVKRYKSSDNISGTSKYVPIFTGANSLANSSIFQEGKFIGFGNTTPNSLLSFAWGTTNVDATHVGTGVRNTRMIIDGGSCSLDLVARDAPADHRWFELSNGSTDMVLKLLADNAAPTFDSIIKVSNSTAMVTFGYGAEVTKEFASTSGIEFPLTVRRTSTGSGTDGIGSGIDFECEDSSGSSTVLNVGNIGFSFGSTLESTFRVQGSTGSAATMLSIDPDGVSTIRNINSNKFATLTVDSSGDLTLASQGGTTALTGNVKLVSGVTIGSGAAGVDYSLTFNGESADCTITFDESESILSIDKSVNITGTNKLYLGNPSYNSYIYSESNYNLTLVAQGNMTHHTSGDHIFKVGTTTEVLRLSDGYPNPLAEITGNLTVTEGVTITGDLKLGNAYVAGAPTPTGYVIIQDSTGTSYKIPAEAV